MKPEPIADPEPKGATSDQVCEPATISNKFIPKPEPEEESDYISVDVLFEYEGMEWSQAENTKADVSVQNSHPIVNIEEWISTMSVSSPSTKSMSLLMLPPCLPPPLPVPCQPRSLYFNSCLPSHGQGNHLITLVTNAI